MKASSLLYATFATAIAVVLWCLWDRSMHFNLWVDYLSPCITPAVLLVGFGAEYHRAVENGREKDGFAAFLKRNWIYYAGFIGVCAVALWWREGFEAIPYILFFGLPYYAGVFVVLALLAGLRVFSPVIGTLWVWFWVGFAIFYAASILTLFAKAWTGIGFLLLLWRPLTQGGLRLLKILGRSSPVFCLAAAGMTLFYWHQNWFWKIPWHAKRIPYSLIPVVVVAGGLLWAVYKFNNTWMRQAAALAGKALASFAVVTALLFLGSAGWNYVGEELSWVEMYRYKVIFEAEKSGRKKRAESVISVERKALGIGRSPVGKRRVRGSLPSIEMPTNNLIRASLSMNHVWLKSLPQAARAAIKNETGESPPLTHDPIELLGLARPKIEAVSLIQGIIGYVEYKDTVHDVQFRAWVKVLDGINALKEIVVVLPKRP